MIATLIACGVLSGAAGFLAGWWRGRADMTSDLDDDLGACLAQLERVRTVCACGEPFVARCPKGLECPSLGVET